MSQSHVGVIGVVGIIIVTIAVILWVAATIRANKNPDTSKARGEAAHRGEVSGGVIQGDPGQQNRRDEAPREERGPLDL